MRILILGEPDTLAYTASYNLVKSLGHSVVDSCPADIAIAPLLTKIITREEINRPNHGTIIFHPSPLPYGRGAKAIKMAYQRGEPVTAATWFWANQGVDKGDICEQEIIKIDYSIRAREFYERDIIPAMLRTLERALKCVDIGLFRRVPQVEAFSSYD